MTKVKILKILPWVITAGALYLVFKDTDWGLLLEHLRSAQKSWLVLAVVFTAASYLLRAYRWEFFFPKPLLTYAQAFKVLILGFFMNNILPARTGELVRAHMGAKLTGEKRTLVLATIASERLVDGITLSLMFLAFGLGAADTAVSSRLMLVALFFGAAAVFLGLVIFKRKSLFSFTDRLAERSDRQATHYAANRFKVFIEGLAPLWSWRRLPAIAGYSVAVWFIELAVYYFITLAFSQSMSLPYCVLFLVAVNFSSLIPAAPGGVGVIEAITTIVLVSVGIPREIALSMVLCQHLIQYFVVGLPGAVVMVTWKKQLKEIESEDSE